MAGIQMVIGVNNVSPPIKLPIYSIFSAAQVASLFVEIREGSFELRCQLGWQANATALRGTGLYR